MNISIDRLKQQKRFPYKQTKKHLGQKRSVLAINVSIELLKRLPMLRQMRESTLSFKVARARGVQFIINRTVFRNINCNYQLKHK